MYSVEFDHDEVSITVMDETGRVGDLQIHAFDDIVYIRQWDPDTDRNHILEINPDMWEELMLAIHSPEGFFIQKRSNK
jgi:hypothetical protein|tara:strand:- start:1146 stop:1379 length:234 start_codon:yes stop_codon:yes gene_type:complete